MELTKQEKKDISALRKAARYINHPDAIRGGKELLRQAKEEKIKRDKDGEKSTFNASLDAARYLVNKARGNIMLTMDYGNSKFFDYEKIFGHS
jgi:hypothetical protein